MDNHIRALREELGLTQELLAEEVGISRNSIWALETGRSKLMNQNIEQLAAALHANFEELRYGRQKAMSILSSSTPGYSSEVEARLREEYEEKLAAVNEENQELRKQILALRQQKKNLETVLCDILQKPLG